MLPRCTGSISPTTTALGLVVLCGLAAPGLGATTVLTPVGDFAAGYEANDYYTDRGSITTFDVWGERVVMWNTAGVEILGRTSGAVEESLGGAPQAWLDLLPPEVDVFTSFTTFDPGGDSIWVGFTTIGNVDDRIYHVRKVGTVWQWEHKATLVGNLELEFLGGVPYASANPAAPWWGAEAAVYRVDTSMPGGLPATDHDLIAEIGGYTAGLAFDAQGNLYYGSYVLSGTWPNAVSSGVLCQFAHDDLSSVIGEGELGPDDAIKLADLAHGAGDVEVDEAGHVMFTINGVDGPNHVAMWDGENTGDGNNYELIAVGTADDGNFFPGLKASGDFTEDGVLYVNDGNFLAPYPGLVGIAVIPEPPTLAMVVAAVLCLFFRRRRCRRRGDG